MRSYCKECGDECTCYARRSCEYHDEHVECDSCGEVICLKKASDAIIEDAQNEIYLCADCRRRGY